MNWYRKSQSEEEDDLTTDAFNEVVTRTRRSMPFERGEDKDEMVKDITELSEIAGMPIPRLTSVGNRAVRVLISLMKDGTLKDGNDFIRAMILYMRINRELSGPPMYENTHNHVEMADMIRKRWNELVP